MPRQPNTGFGHVFTCKDEAYREELQGQLVPLYASTGPQYYFGRDFSVGTVDSNYMGTPFLTQYLSDGREDLRKGK